MEAELIDQAGGAGVPAAACLGGQPEQLEEGPAAGRGAPEQLEQAGGAGVAADKRALPENWFGAEEVTERVVTIFGLGVVTLEHVAAIAPEQSSPSSSLVEPAVMRSCRRCGGAKTCPACWDLPSAATCSSCGMTRTCQACKGSGREVFEERRDEDEVPF